MQGWEIPCDKENIETNWIDIAKDCSVCYAYTVTMAVEICIKKLTLNDLANKKLHVDSPTGLFRNS